MNRMIGVVLAGAMTLLSTSAFAAPVDRRLQLERARIAQDARMGKVDFQQRERLEGRAGQLRREIRRDRAMHGGRLTLDERRHVNREENRLSRHLRHDRQR